MRREKNVLELILTVEFDCGMYSVPIEPGIKTNFKINLFPPPQLSWGLISGVCFGPGEDFLEDRLVGKCVG